MKKKLLALLMTMIMITTLSACGQDMSTSSNNSDTVDVEELEQRIAELEAENSELKTQLENQKTDESQLTDNQETGEGQLASTQVQSLISSTTDSPETTGVCGANLTWYYKEGVLYITGTGAMTDYGVLNLGAIPWYDFSKKINWVIVDEGVTTIGNTAFFECGYISKVVLPDTITSIGKKAFESCGSLTEINIPNSVTSIGEYAFDNCSSLTEITLPNSITSIDLFTFGGCKSLTEITIPNSVTSIGGGAFGYCSSLTEITIPNSVTSIGSDAFSGCSSLTEITIPNSVTSMGRLFYYNDKLAEITFLCEAPEDLTHVLGHPNEPLYANGEDINKYRLGIKNATIYYSSDSFEEYINAETELWEYNNITWVKQ